MSFRLSPTFRDRLAAASRPLAGGWVCSGSALVAEIMAAAITGDSRDFELFAGARHWRLPVGRYLGNRALAVGMWYFQKLEALR